MNGAEIDRLLHILMCSTMFVVMSVVITLMILGIVRL